MDNKSIEIGKILVKNIQEKKQPISYEAVMAQVGVDHFEIAKHLSEVSWKCKELGLPPLSVTVTFKDRPNENGSGFYKEFAPCKKEEQLEVFTNYFSQCLESDWNILLAALEEK